MNYEFIEGDLVYVKNEVIIPANEYMINSFGGRVFTIKRIVTDGSNYKGSARQLVISYGRQTI